MGTLSSAHAAGCARMRVRARLRTHAMLSNAGSVLRGLGTSFDVDDVNWTIRVQKFESCT